MGVLGAFRAEALAGVIASHTEDGVAVRDADIVRKPAHVRDRTPLCRVSLQTPLTEDMTLGDTIVSVKRFMGRGADDPETRRLGPYRFATDDGTSADPENAFPGKGRQ